MKKVCLHSINLNLKRILYYRNIFLILMYIELKNDASKNKDTIRIAMYLNFYFCLLTEFVTNSLK